MAARRGCRVGARPGDRRRDLPRRQRHQRRRRRGARRCDRISSDGFSAERPDGARRHGDRPRRTGRVGRPARIAVDDGLRWQRRDPRAGTTHRTRFPTRTCRRPVRQRHPASRMGLQEARRQHLMGGLRRPRRPERGHRGTLAADVRPEREVPTPSARFRHPCRGLPPAAGVGGVQRRPADLHLTHLLGRIASQRQAGDLLRDRHLRHRRVREPVPRAGHEGSVCRVEVSRRRVQVQPVLRRPAHQSARRHEEPVVLQLRHRHPRRHQRSDPAGITRLHPDLEHARRCVPRPRRAQ